MRFFRTASAIAIVVHSSSRPLAAVRSAPAEDHGMADVTGDGYPDLVVWKTDGTMWLSVVIIVVRRSR